MKHKYSRGFTLIELLIVVAILAIIATIVLFALVGPRSSAYEGEIVGRIIEVNNTIVGWKVEIAPVGSVVPYGKVFITRDKLLAEKARDYMHTKREVLARYKAVFRKTISSLTPLEETQR